MPKCIWDLYYQFPKLSIQICCYPFIIYINKDKDPVLNFVLFFNLYQKHFFFHRVDFFQHFLNSDVNLVFYSWFCSKNQSFLIFLFLSWIYKNQDSLRFLFKNWDAIEKWHNSGTLTLGCLVTLNKLKRKNCYSFIYPL